MPNGFHVLSVDGSACETRFVPAKEPDGRQIRVSVLSRFHDEMRRDDRPRLSPGTHPLVVEALNEYGRTAARAFVFAFMVIACEPSGFVYPAGRAATLPGEDGLGHDL